jgi:hypothetical protein
MGAAGRTGEEDRAGFCYGGAGPGDGAEPAVNKASLQHLLL